MARFIHFQPLLSLRICRLNSWHGHDSRSVFLSILGKLGRRNRIRTAFKTVTLLLLLLIWLKFAIKRCVWFEWICFILIYRPYVSNLSIDWFLVSYCSLESLISLIPLTLQFLLVLYLLNLIIGCVILIFLFLTLFREL